LISSEVVTAFPFVTLRVHCASCGGEVELECEPLQGFWGYRTYNAYFCPYCRKQNHVLSSGAVVRARPVIGGEAR
jgi:hypothetical protein